jgi:hypothetical protein
MRSPVSLYLAQVATEVSQTKPAKKVKFRFPGAAGSVFVEYLRGLIQKRVQAAAVHGFNP